MPWTRCKSFTLSAQPWEGRGGPEKQPQKISPRLFKAFLYTTFKHNAMIQLSLAPVSLPARLSNGRLPVYLVQDFYYYQYYYSSKGNMVPL